MPNFSIKFSYTVNEVVYHKTAIVRATDPERAKNKIVDFFIACLGHVSSFAFSSVSVSSYNLVLV